MKPVQISVPGSKSVINRLLALSALGKGEIALHNVNFCDDVKFMIKGLRQLGVKITQTNQTLKIKGANGKFPKKSATVKIYTENAGTATRFLTAIATLTNSKVTISGNADMNRRPIAELTKALKNLGANISDTLGCPPLHISPSAPHKKNISIPGNISSQYISALMMIAPLLPNGLTVNLEQEVYSKPYINLTIESLKQFKIKIKNKNFRQIKIPAQKIINPKIIRAESDASSASYPAAFAALHYHSPILLKNISTSSKQGDIKFLAYLKKMGCEIIPQKSDTLIHGPKILKSLGKIDMNETPDLAMTFAILATLTKGKTEITNIANLKVKETDRLKAMEKEISKLGIKIKATKDSLIIHGNPSLKIPKTIKINSKNDHRIAMSFALLQSHFPRLEISNPDCVAKSYPTFWHDLQKLKNSTKNIILIGLRGSGKTKLGKILAKKLKTSQIDTDLEIEKFTKQNINKIVQQKGWKYFRKIESKIIEKISDSHSTIISTGGGAILDPKNRKALKRNGVIIYLHRKPEICTKIIAQSHARPALTNSKSPLSEMKKLYKDRHPLYKKSASFSINRTKNLHKDAEKIIATLSHPHSNHRIFF